MKMNNPDPTEPTKPNPVREAVIAQLWEDLDDKYPHGMSVDQIAEMIVRNACHSLTVAQQHEAALGEATAQMAGYCSHTQTVCLCLLWHVQRGHDLGPFRDFQLQAAACFGKLLEKVGCAS